MNNNINRKNGNLTFWLKKVKWQMRFTNIFLIAHGPW